MGDFKLTENTLLLSTKIEDLWIDKYDAQHCNTLFASAFAQNLLKLHFSHFPRPKLEPNLFSNLVIVHNVNLEKLTLNHLPKVMLLVQCKLNKTFFSKPCTVLSKRWEESKNYECIEDDRFYTGMERYYIIPLCNFDIRNAYLLPREQFSIVVDGIRNKDAGPLIGWMRHTDEKKNSTLEIKKGYFGVKRNILEKRTKRQLPWIKITSV